MSMEGITQLGFEMKTGKIVVTILFEQSNVI